MIFDMIFAHVLEIFPFKMLCMDCRAFSYHRLSYLFQEDHPALQVITIGIYTRVIYMQIQVKVSS